MNVGIYLRVSTKKQELGTQRHLLMKVLKANPEWKLVEVFEDFGISGGKGRKKRPGFDRLCNAVEQGQIDMVMTISADRLSRTKYDMLVFMMMLERHGCNLYLDRERLDTTTFYGQAFLYLMSIFNDMERSLISARIKERIEYGKSLGKVYGRAPVYTAAQLEKVRKLHLAGFSCREIARETRMGLGTVGREVAKLHKAG
jgi:DNA invertase Pin-like site-specific DNA recombinase